MGADAVDIGKTIHPPPTLGELVQEQALLELMANLLGSLLSAELAAAEAVRRAERAECDYFDAQAMLQRLQEHLAQADVKASVGMAMRKPGDDLNETFALADAEMYAVKRNRSKPREQGGAVLAAERGAGAALEQQFAVALGVHFDCRDRGQAHGGAAVAALESGSELVQQPGQGLAQQMRAGRRVQHDAMSSTLTMRVVPRSGMSNWPTGGTGGIGGNGGNGVHITNSDNATIQANFFGIGADNATTVGNAQNGILVDGDSRDTTVGGVIPLGNVSAGNGQNGIY
eukprot:gene45997-57344_t